MPQVPANEFTLTRRVQFYETDLAGMVHFSWYARYMEEAEHALWREAGLGITSAPTGVGFPRVSLSVDFQAPLRFEELFTITIRIEEMTRRTIRYACVITRDGTMVATGSLTAACVRRTGKTMESVDIPDEIRARLAVPVTERPPTADPV
jgi:YbgC/YbaW family acyl-CoA thioester hydrolase